MAFTNLLESFARLLDFFDKELRERQQKLDQSLETAWNQYFKSDSPSFRTEIDQILRHVLRLNLKTITLLYENKLEVPDAESNQLSKDKLKQYQRQWARAQKKLAKLQERIFELDSILGETEAIEDYLMAVRDTDASPLPQPSVKNANIRSEILHQAIDENTEEEAVAIEPEVTVDHDIESDFSEAIEPDVSTETSEIHEAYEEVELEEIVTDSDENLPDEDSETVEDELSLNEPEEFTYSDEPSETSDVFIDEEFHTADLSPDDFETEETPFHEIVEETEQISIDEQDIESSGLEELEVSSEVEDQEDDPFTETTLDASTPDEFLDIEKDLKRETTSEFLVSEDLANEAHEDSFADLLSEDDKKALEEAESILSGVDWDGDEEIEIEEISPVETIDEKSVEEDAAQEKVEIEEELIEEKAEPERDKPTSLRIAELQEKLAPFKKIYSQKGDLKIKTRTGEWTLSLPYYQLEGTDGKVTRLLDVENFIGLHNLAIKGVEDVQKNLGSGVDKEDVQKMLTRMQKYFSSLYANVHEIIGPEGERIFPDLGEEFDPDTLIMIETNLSLEGWEEVDDLLAFKETFDDAIADPFRKFVENPENRLQYFASIVKVGNIG